MSSSKYRGNRIEYQVKTAGVGSLRSLVLVSVGSYWGSRWSVVEKIRVHYA